MRGSEVPGGWRRETLGNLGTFVKCQGGSKKDEVPNGVPVVRYGQLYTRYDTVIREFFSFVSPERAGDYTPLKFGDILFAGSGETLDEIGKAAVFLGAARAHGSGDLVLLRPSDAVDPLFLGYSVNSDDANGQKMRLGQGSSVFHISAERLAGIRIPVPPLPEQKKIAAILSSVDEAIQATQAVVDQIRRVKEGLLQHLLVRGIGHTRFKQTEIGEIPEGWEVDLIENVADISTGGRDTKNRVSGGQYPFFVRSQTVERIDTFAFDGEAILTAGDGVGTGKVFHYIRGKFDYHQRVYCLSGFRGRVRGRFLYYYFSTFFIEQVRRYSAKNSVDSVRKPMIARMLVPLPPLVEQDRLITLFAAQDEAEAVELRKLERLHRVKSGLLHNLLTGRVRVTP